jgi:D-Tyr-tRNAtyr deacylase
MRVVVQRVREASVTVAGEVVATCDRGVVVLLGVAWLSWRWDRAVPAVLS